MIPEINQDGVMFKLNNNSVIDLSDTVGSNIREGYHIVPVDQTDDITVMVSRLETLQTLINQSLSDATLKLGDIANSINNKMNVVIDTTITDKLEKINKQIAELEIDKNLQVAINLLKEDQITATDDAIKNLTDHLTVALNNYATVDALTKTFKDLLTLGILAKGASGEFVGIKMLADGSFDNTKLNSSMLFSADNFFFVGDDNYTSSSPKIAPFSMLKDATTNTWRLVLNGQVEFSNSNISTTCLDKYMNSKSLGLSDTNALKETQKLSECGLWQFNADITTILGNYLATQSILTDKLVSNTAFFNTISVGLRTGNFGGSIVADPEYFRYTVPIARITDKEIVNFNKASATDNKVKTIDYIYFLVTTHDNAPFSFYIKSSYDPATELPPAINTCYIVLSIKIKVGDGTSVPAVFTQSDAVLRFSGNKDSKETSQWIQTPSSNNNLAWDLSELVNILIVPGLGDLKDIDLSTILIDYYYIGKYDTEVVKRTCNVTLNYRENASFLAKARNSFRYAVDDATYTIKSYDKVYIDIITLFKNTANVLEKSSVKFNEDPYKNYNYYLILGKNSDRKDITGSVIPTDSNTYTCFLSKLLPVTVSKGDTSFEIGVQVIDKSSTSPYSVFEDYISIPVVYKSKTCYSWDSTKTKLLVKETFADTCPAGWFSDDVSGTDLASSSVEISLSSYTVSHQHSESSSQVVKESIKPASLVVSISFRNVVSPEIGKSYTGTLTLGKTDKTIVITDTSVVNTFTCDIDCLFNLIKCPYSACFENYLTNVSIKFEVNVVKNGLPLTLTDSATLTVLPLRGEDVRVSLSNSFMHAIKDATGSVLTNIEQCRIQAFSGGEELTPVENCKNADGSLFVWDSDDATMPNSSYAIYSDAKCTQRSSLPAGIKPVGGTNYYTTSIDPASYATSSSEVFTFYVKAKNSVGVVGTSTAQSITFAINSNGRDGINGVNGRAGSDGSNGTTPCSDMIWVSLPATGGCAHYETLGDTLANAPSGVKIQHSKPSMNDLKSYPCIGVYNNSSPCNDVTRLPFNAYSWIANKRGPVNSSRDVILSSGNTHVDYSKGIEDTHFNKLNDATSLYARFSVMQRVKKHPYFQFYIASLVDKSNYSYTEALKYITQKTIITRRNTEVMYTKNNGSYNFSSMDALQFDIDSNGAVTGLPRGQAEVVVDIINFPSVERGLKFSVLGSPSLVLHTASISGTTITSSATGFIVTIPDSSSGDIVTFNYSVNMTVQIILKSLNDRYYLPTGQDSELFLTRSIDKEFPSGLLEASPSLKMISGCSGADASSKVIIDNFVFMTSYEWSPTTLNSDKTKYEQTFYVATLPPSTDITWIGLAGTPDEYWTGGLGLNIMLPNYFCKPYNSTYKPTGKYQFSDKTTITLAVAVSSDEIGTSKLTLTEYFKSVLDIDYYSGRYLVGDTLNLNVYGLAQISTDSGGIKLLSGVEPVTVKHMVCAGKDACSDSSILDNVAMFIDGSAIVSGTLAVNKLQGLSELHNFTLGRQISTTYSARTGEAFGAELGWDSVISVESRGSSEDPSYESAISGKVNASRAKIVYATATQQPLPTTSCGVYGGVDSYLNKTSSDDDITAQVKLIESYAAQSGVYGVADVNLTVDPRNGVRYNTSRSVESIGMSIAGVVGFGSGYASGVIGESSEGYSGYFSGGKGVFIKGGLSLEIDGKVYSLTKIIKALESDVLNSIDITV